MTSDVLHRFAYGEPVDPRYEDECDSHEAFRNAQRAQKYQYRYADPLDAWVTAIRQMAGAVKLLDQPKAGNGTKTDGRSAVHNCNYQLAITEVDCRVANAEDWQTRSALPAPFLIGFNVVPVCLDPHGGTTDPSVSRVQSVVCCLCHAGPTTKIIAGKRVGRAYRKRKEEAVRREEGLKPSEIASLLGVKTDQVRKWLRQTKETEGGPCSHCASGGDGAKGRFTSGPTASGCRRSASGTKATGSGTGGPSMATPRARYRENFASSKPMPPPGGCSIATALPLQSSPPMVGEHSQAETHPGDGPPLRATC